MGKPLFKASEGGRIDIFREWEEVTQSELQQWSGAQVLLTLTVHPCPYGKMFCNIKVEPCEEKLGIKDEFLPICSFRYWD